MADNSPGLPGRGEGTVVEASLNIDPVFLEGTQIRERVEQTLASATCADLAVAYWGNASIPMLTAEPWSKPTRIICDLMSGFCHVPTIRALQAKGCVQVKRSDRFHAKVYLTPKAAIVGSANASAHGLNGQPDSNKEAALLTTRQDVLAIMKTWFEQQWGGATVFTDTELAEAERRWKTRKESEPLLIPDHLTEEQQFFKVLSPVAREVVMSWARAQPSVAAIRFGMMGDKGTDPNFQAIYKDGTTESYWYPAQGGNPKKRTPEWDSNHLTRAIPVFRGDSA